MKFNLLSSSKIETNMRVFVILLFVVTYLLSISCEDEKMPTETIDPRLLKVVGDYKATKYIYPSELDAPTDILKLGGSIIASIKTDKTISGRIIIPKEFNHREVGTDYFFSGTVKFIGNDTIQFIDTKVILSAGGFYFRIEGDSLIAEASTISYIGVTLKKLKKDIQY